MRSNFSFNWQEDRRASFYVEYVNLETIFYIIIDEWNTLSYSTAGHGRVFGIRYVETLREPSTRTGFWTSWYIETYLWLLMTRLLGRGVWFNQAGKYVLLYQICIGVEIYLIIYFSGITKLKNYFISWYRWSRVSAKFNIEFVGADPQSGKSPLMFLIPDV